MELVLYELAALALLFVQLIYIFDLKLPSEEIFQFLWEFFEKGFALTQFLVVFFLPLHVLIDLGVSLGEVVANLVANLHFFILEQVLQLELLVCMKKGGCKVD
jgi:hypothetical protein